MAARLFRPCGLVPPGIAEHSVKILHFKINHSRPEHKEKDAHIRTHVHARTRKQNVHSHNMFYREMSSVQLRQGSLCMSRQCVIAGCCEERMSDHQLSHPEIIYST